MSNRYDLPHGHTEAEVREAGGMSGCPVCLRADLREAAAAVKRLRRAVARSRALFHQITQCDGDDIQSIAEQMSHDAQTGLRVCDSVMAPPPWVAKP